MFGFSLPKLILTIVVVVGVWYVFKWLGRGDAMSDDEVEDKGGAKAATKSVDLVKCPTCGTYLPAGQDHDCPGA